MFFGGQTRLEFVCIDQMKMTELDIPGARGIIRPRPVVLDVVNIAQRVKLLLPARRCDVQGFPRLKIHPGGQDVDVHTAVGFFVPDGGPGIAIRIEAGPGQALEVVEEIVDLIGRWRIIRGPGNDRGRGAVFEGQGVGDSTDELWIAAHHLDAGAHPAFVICLSLQLLCGRGPGCAAGMEFNHHGSAPDS